MADEIVFSILCLSYNHEKYIRQALQSFVEQKCPFRYEILINDDASTDGTASVIREFQEKYPDLIRPFLQKENLYSKKVGIYSKILFPEARGKYIAFCETDDFWTDEYKLLKMYRLFTEHPETGAWFHRVIAVNKDASRKTFEFPRTPLLKPGVYSSREMLSWLLDTRTSYCLQFQFSGFTIERELYADYICHKPDYAAMWDVGDMPLFLFAAWHKPCGYTDEPMSCYREGVAGSWNSRLNSDEKRKKHYELEKQCLLLFDEASGRIAHDDVLTAVKIRDFCYYRSICSLKKLRSEEFSEIYATLSEEEKRNLVISRRRRFRSRFRKKIKAFLMDTVGLPLKGSDPGKQNPSGKGKEQ